jgi:signal transduction histidine kinase
MSQIETSKFIGSAGRCLFGIIALIAVTFVCFRLRLNVATSGFFYLIVIVLLSLAGDLVSSVVISLSAAGCLSYFFMSPVFSLRVNELQDLIAIIAFLTTSLVISRLVSKLRAKSEEVLFTVNRKLIDAEERERTRIARELHDDIVQRVAVVTIGLDCVQQDFSDLPNEVRSQLSKLQKQTSDIGVDIQSVSHELHSANLEYLGMAAAMKGFCREIEEHRKVKIDFNAHDMPSFVPPDISLSLFRVLQEALQNAAKHSGARHFDVELFVASERVHLTVHDSGSGFDSKAAMKGQGLGLVSMQERLKLVKGEFSIDSQPNRGTTIHADVPFSSSRSSARAAG